MLSLVRSARADEDLIAIWLHDAQFGASAADRTIDDIERRWLQLLEFPMSGVARDDIAAGVRHLVCGRYLILYRATTVSIEILRVLHGRRRIDEEALER